MRGEGKRDDYILFQQKMITKKHKHKSPFYLELLSMHFCTSFKLYFYLFGFFYLQKFYKVRLTALLEVPYKYLLVNIFTSKYLIF
jgi:hypothetical protein